MTTLERWHAVYDAALDAGCDHAEACYRADHLYWPDSPPPGLEFTSPFREMAEEALAS